MPYAKERGLLDLLHSFINANELSNGYHSWTFDQLKTISQELDSESAKKLYEKLNRGAYDGVIEYIPYAESKGRTSAFVLIWRTNNGDTSILTHKEFLSNAKSK